MGKRTRDNKIWNEDLTDWMSAREDKNNKGETVAPTIRTTDKEIQTMTKIALMAAVTCILGPLSIPIGQVPISFTNLAVYFAVYLLGTKKGTISYVVYMLLGLVGLPVFSGFQGGPAKLFGVTGGYIIGFVFMAAICGIFIDRWPDKYYMHFIGMVLGTAVCYLFGTVWFVILAKCNIVYALSVCVFPFIIGDIVKIIIAMLAGPQIRKRLVKAGLY